MSSPFFNPSPTLSLASLSITKTLPTLLSSYYNTYNITYEYVPPQNHRSLPAKRCVRTAKTHVTSVMSAVHVSFPGLTSFPSPSSRSIPSDPGNPTRLSRPGMVCIVLAFALHSTPFTPRPACCCPRSPPKPGNLGPNIAPEDSTSLLPPTTIAALMFSFLLLAPTASVKP
jgi:hypothetical protein